MENGEPIQFSTFASNYLLFLHMAEKYQDEIVWIFKPHPQLKYKAIRAGIFKDINEWELYIDRWRKLKNAAVIEEGEYWQLFMNSDAMILDSISFLAEYLYVHKPLLFLQGPKQQFNEFGKMLIDVHYCADGNDEKAIEYFIQEVVLKGHDELYKKREQFFDNNMNYVRTNGKDAATGIYEWISSMLDKEKKYEFNGTL